jgi:hypothetical protein
MPVEILTAAQRAEWERFPAEIDKLSLARCFSFPDDELERIVELKGGPPTVRAGSDGGRVTLVGVRAGPAAARERGFMASGLSRSKRSDRSCCNNRQNPPIPLAIQPSADRHPDAAWPEGVP